MHGTTTAPVADRVLEIVRAWVHAPAPPARAERTSTSAGVPLANWYPAAGQPIEHPGTYPFTRGTTARGYLDQPWVMGMYSGYASAAETNKRFKNLLAAGQSGFSIAMDLPTQIGIDPDHPLAAGEVGKVGVSLASVEDMLTLLDGVPLDRVRQMRTTANAIGPIFAALLLVALEELGADPHTFRLLLQNDPLKEFSARGTYIFPPRASVRFAVDVVEYFAQHFPTWEPIEFCGYHLRDAGGTAVQEVAIATANGLAYLDAARARGVDITALAHTLFVFLSTSVDIFEEAAKLRATRRIWARILHELYDVPQEQAKVNLFVYTLGGALVAQEPLNNAIRVAYEALAAVLGGTQTLSTSSYDEALGLPSTGAAHLALRTQQIIAFESGAANVVDPLGGSYYVEALTDALEAEILAYLAKLLEHGGAVAALESGFIGGELSSAAYALQASIESGARPIVGVNIHKADVEAVTGRFTVREDVQAQAIQGVQDVRRGRNAERVEAALERVTAAAALDATGTNTLPALIEATRARATTGEMVEALARVWGRQAVGVSAV
jgi:methylmalonyl-CoA mutase N-terminal domain/subunit